MKFANQSWDLIALWCATTMTTISAVVQLALATMTMTITKLWIPLEDHQEWMAFRVVLLLLRTERP